MMEEFFLVTLMLLDVSSKKMCLERHPAYPMNADKISNSMVENYLLKERRKIVVVIANVLKINWGFDLYYPLPGDQC